MDFNKLPFLGTFQHLIIQCERFYPKSFCIDLDKLIKDSIVKISTGEGYLWLRFLARQFSTVLAWSMHGMNCLTYNFFVTWSCSAPFARHCLLL